MDQALVRFREAAARENRGRHGVRRRYSRIVRQQAVEDWLTRRRHGERLRDVAAALGVAHWSLHRWARESKRHARFRPVAVVASAPPPVAPSLAVVLGATGPRVEGLDVESAARLLALLR
jgi:transposase-like protein